MDTKSSLGCYKGIHHSWLFDISFPTSCGFLLNKELLLLLLIFTPLFSDSNSCNVFSFLSTPSILKLDSFLGRCLCKSLPPLGAASCDALTHLSSAAKLLPTRIPEETQRRPLARTQRILLVDEKVGKGKRDS